MRIPYKIVDEGSFVIPNFDKYLKDNEEHWDLGDRKEKFIKDYIPNNPIDLSSLNHQELSEIEDGCYEFEYGDAVWEMFEEYIYWFIQEG